MSEIERMGATSVVSEILKREREIPDKPAYIFLGRNSRRTVLTFSDISNLAQKFAARLRSRGIVTGDVVCNTLPTSPERLITQLGTMMAGAIFMAGNMSLEDGSDFLRSLKDGRVKAVIHSPARRFYEILKENATHANKDGGITCPDIPSLEMLISCNLESSNGSEKSLLEELGETSERFCVDNGPTSVCSYFCTSGSTGAFKLVSLTSQFLIDFAMSLCKIVGLDRQSVLFNERLFGWIAGAPTFVFCLGCTRVTVEDTVPRDEGYPRFVKENLRQENCTAIITNSIILENLVDESELDDHSNLYLLKSFAVLGAPASSNILQGIGTVTERLSNIYGSTETGVEASITLTSRDDDFSDFLCGWSFEGTEFKIVDSSMEGLPVGDTGEILAKPSKIAKGSLGYVNNDKANKETFLSDGWVRLGDVGFLNAKGQLTVLGRGGDVINRGGACIYPAQLEAPLSKCPGLAEVLVTGVPDQTTLEESCALLVRSQGAGEEIDEDYVHRFCEETFLVKSEIPIIPKYLRFVDAIPKVSNGKVGRKVAKRLAAQLVGSSGTR